MTSAKQEGASTATEQLGSMSLGESAERNDDGTEPTSKNGTTPTKKFCSACGKKSDALMKCRACKCVWYCDKDCQNKHWKEHKKECKRIKNELDNRGGKLDVGTELDVGPIGKVPQRGECPICMHTLPIDAGLQSYTLCCGKLVCGGCDYQHEIKSGCGGRRTCAFCRTAVPKSDEENLVQSRKRVELKDPTALYNLALWYGKGRCGLPVDQAKCIELLRESAGLGFPSALCQLGNFYDNGEMGLEQNEEEAFRYHKKAAECGHLISRHNLGCIEDMNGDDVAAMRHWRLSASGGFKPSMKSLIRHFEHGLLHQDDLAETLQALYRARAEMKSKDRDQYIAYLKTTGEYHE